MLQRISQDHFVVQEDCLTLTANPLQITLYACRQPLLVRADRLRVRRRLFSIAMNSIQVEPQFTSPSPPNSSPGRAWRIIQLRLCTEEMHARYPVNHLLTIVARWSRP
jgi:hypothetical protein